MSIQPIYTDADLARTFARMKGLWAAVDGTQETDELEVLSILSKKYGDGHYPIGPSDRSSLDDLCFAWSCRFKADNL